MCDQKSVNHKINHSTPSSLALPLVAPQIVGANFTQVPSTPRHWWFADCSYDGLVCLVTAEKVFLNGVIARSTNRGLNFTEVPGTSVSPTDYFSVSITANGSWAVASLDGGALYRSNDSGASFYPIPGTTGPTPSPYYWYSVSCGKTSQYCLAVQRTSGVWRSQDYGFSFSVVSPTTSLNTQTVACRADGQVCLLSVYVSATSAQIWRTNNTGLTWTNTGFAPNGLPRGGLTSSADGQYW